MKTLLAHLSSTLVEINHPILELIEPPLSRKEIEGILTRAKLGRNEKIISLYEFCGWLNPSNLFNDTYTELLPFGFPLNFRGTISAYCLKKDDKILSKRLPLMTNKKGDFIVVDLDEKSRNYGKLMACVTGEFFFDTTEYSKLVSIYDSAETFIKTIDECYKVGAYQLCGRIINIDKEMERKVSEKLNPQSDFWK
jgi:hypothetical protein